MGVEDISQDEADWLAWMLGEICTSRFGFCDFYKESSFDRNYGDDKIKAHLTSESGGALHDSILEYEGKVVFDYDGNKGVVRVHIPGEWKTHVDEVYKKVVSDRHTINL